MSTSNRSPDRTQPKEPDMYEHLHTTAVRMETSALIGDIAVAGHVATARATRRAQLVRRITAPAARLFNRGDARPVTTPGVAVTAQ